MLGQRFLLSDVFLATIDPEEDLFKNFLEEWVSDFGDVSQARFPKVKIDLDGTNLVCEGTLGDVSKKQWSGVDLMCVLFGSTPNVRRVVVRERGLGVASRQAPTTASAHLQVGPG